MDILFLIIGLIVLVLGGEFLVKGAVGFSSAMKISPLIIGMTVVAFGTSAPELIVSLTSSLDGTPDIAVGNVVGSNIANIALVLGITVLIFPIVADRQTKRLDLPMMLFATFLFFFFAKDGLLTLIEGVVLLLTIITFTIFLIRKGRKQSIASGNDIDWTEERNVSNYWRALFFLHLGFVGLYFGADWFIDGAVVAFGTSAPELVASCVAAYRKQTDISIGNLIGSNIFNILVVLGVTSTVTPIPVSQELLEFDILWMIGVALLLVLLVAIGSRIGRLKGAIFLSTYIGYIVIIVLKVQGKI